MPSPNILLQAQQRTPGGALLTNHAQQLRELLVEDGMVLLPSDTCYSLAALADDPEIQGRINAVLQREKMPISLSFANLESVSRLVKVDPVARLLLMRFTPGPLTVVCQAQDHVGEDFFSHCIGSHHRTIGVRIPDSAIEREVAAITPFPLTSVAVRDPRSGSSDGVRDFQRAKAIVEEGMARIGSHRWAAIEGPITYDGLSTVVQVGDGDAPLTCLREGRLAFDTLQAALGQRKGATAP